MESSEEDSSTSITLLNNPKFLCLKSADNKKILIACNVTDKNPVTRFTFFSIGNNNGGMCHEMDCIVYTILPRALLNEKTHASVSSGFWI